MEIVEPSKTSTDENHQCPCGIHLPLKQKMFIVDDQNRPLCHKCIVSLWKKFDEEDRQKEREANRKLGRTWQDMA